MLAQLETPTNDFMALASYLIQGDVRPTPASRVAWTLARHLPTDDPILAAQFMAATAQLSRRCTHACYHAMIAWHPDEQPTPALMQDIAARTLVLADLGEHQALIMGHGDKAHPHLHMMINRVHPETGRAWATSHDYRRFDRIMKRLSGEFGFRYVPPHVFEPELTETLDKAPGSAARYAAKRGAPTTRVQGSRRAARLIGAEVSERLDHASGWDDIAFALAEHGLTLEAKGHGLVAGNSTGYVKFSALGLTASAAGLARRFGHAYSDRTSIRRPPLRRPSSNRSWWHIDAIDIARALGTRDDVREAVQDVRSVRLARRAKLSVIRQLMAELADDLRASTALTRRSTKQRRERRSRPPIRQDNRSSRIGLTFKQRSDKT